MALSRQEVIAGIEATFTDVAGAVVGVSEKTATQLVKSVAIELGAKAQAIKKTRREDEEFEKARIAFFKNRELIV